MRALKGAVYDLLAGDPTIAGALSGGVYGQDELSAGTVGPASLPMGVWEDDMVRVKPFGVITWKTGAALEPVGIGAELVVLEVWLYEQSGYAAIDVAVLRIKQLLDHAPLPVDVAQTRLAWSTWGGELGEAFAEEYGNISMNRVSFDISILRRR